MPAVRDPRRREPGDRNVSDAGVATVFACAACVVLLALAGLAVQLGAVLLARHRAQVAADLAALAGAALVLRGEQAACNRAIELVYANKAELVSCEVIGADLLVRVSFQVRAGPLLGAGTGRARAGPVAATIG